MAMMMEKQERNRVRCICTVLASRANRSMRICTALSIHSGREMRRKRQQQLLRGIRVGDNKVGCIAACMDTLAVVVVGRGRIVAA